MTGAGTPLRGALLLYDALDADIRRIRTARPARLPGLRRTRHGAGMLAVRPVGYILGWLVLLLGR